MGFETQEEAERWAENAEFRADQLREERLLATSNEGRKMPERFKLFGGQLYDGGAKITPQELEATLLRNYQAIMSNRAAGPLGELGNRALLPEWRQAYETYRSLQPGATTPLDAQFRPLFEAYPLK